MLTNESSASAQYRNAVQQWNFITSHEDCAFTIKSIFITLRMALNRVDPLEDPEEVGAVLQLLNMGEILADVEYGRSDFEYEQAHKEAA